MRKQTIKPAVFDGTNNLLSTAGVFAPPNKGFTFLATINANSLDATANIVGIRNATYIRVSATAISTFFKNATASANISLSINRDYSIALSVSEIDFKSRVYLDGVMIAESLGLADLSLTELTVMRIGAEWDSARLFDGSISNVAFFSRGLSSDEVKQIHNNSLTVSPTSFKRLGITDEITAIYSLDSENEGIDLSGNGNHLSNINNVTFDGSPVDTLHTGIQAKAVYAGDGLAYLSGGNSLTLRAQNKDFFFSCFYEEPSNRTGTTYIFRTSSTFTAVYITTSIIIFRYNTLAGTVLATADVGLLNPSKINHISASVNNTTLEMKLYINGVLEAQEILLDNNQIPQFYCVIGASLNGSLAVDSTLHSLYFGEEDLGQAGVDWFRNKGYGRDFSFLLNHIYNSAHCIYPLDYENRATDISENGRTFSEINTPVYTAIIDKQKISNYQTGL